MGLYNDCLCTYSTCRHSRDTQSRTTSSTTTTTKTATKPNKKPTYEQLVGMNNNLKLFHFISATMFLCVFLVFAYNNLPAGRGTRETLATEISHSGVVNETCQVVLDSGAVDVLVPLRREVYDDGRLFDISHRIQPNMPSWGSRYGIGQVVSFSKSMKNGSLANNSEMKLATHTGTHVDAPGHVFDHYFDAGFDVDALDLATLNGPALLVDVPRHTNITAKAMGSLHIPKGIKRVLFRTLNTARRLMWKKEFDTSYVGFMKDGAQWLVDNTDIKFVGVDYLSAAAYDDLIPAHHVFLESREIILVEGLKLDNIEAGAYTVHCLPLRLVGAEGSPVRCILVK